MTLDAGQYAVQKHSKMVKCAQQIRLAGPICHFPKPSLQGRTAMSDSNSTTRVCKVCNGTDFTKSGTCRACNRVRNIAYRKANLEKENARNTEYRKNNPEKFKAIAAESRKRHPDANKKRCAEWVAKNQDKIKEYSKSYYLINSGSIKEKHKEIRAKNPEKAKEYYERRKRENPERCRELSRKWQAENREILNARARQKRLDNPLKEIAKGQNKRALRKKAKGKLSLDISEKLHKLQKGKCACCGKSLGDNYHLDHIMPIALGGSNTDDNIQLLRQRCNQEKHAKHPVDFMQQRGFLL